MLVFGICNKGALRIMSCNPTVNSFNHILEQYIDWSKCELELCDKEISCRKCKKNMLSVYNNKIRKEERKKVLEKVRDLTFREVTYTDSLNDRTEFRELLDRLY